MPVKTVRAFTTTFDNEVWELLGKHPLNKLSQRCQRLHCACLQESTYGNLLWDESLTDMRCDSLLFFGPCLNCAASIRFSLGVEVLFSLATGFHLLWFTDGVYRWQCT